VSAPEEGTWVSAEPRRELTRDSDRPRSGRQHLPRGALVMRQVPLPLPGRDRVAWRVAALVLCLSACRGRSATVEQLHVLSWSLRDEANARSLMDVWERRPGAPAMLRAWDTKLDDTLQLAAAAGLIEQRSSGRQALTQKGDNLVTALMFAADGPMESERQFLASLGRLTESGMWKRLGSPARRTSVEGPEVAA
jgi:hypothetical protein